MKKSIFTILITTLLFACNNPEKKELSSDIVITQGKPQEKVLVVSDFTLNNPEGNPISLSSIKGEVILIDFWASWCGPCRRENPNLVKVYNTYKDQGFNILSVSLDGVPQQQTAKQDWINAIKADGLIWKNHVSDLKGWNSSVVQTFNLNSIPSTLLIDNDGNVIGKDLRGKALENKLSSIFN